jgi:hypothetical protein
MEVCAVLAARLPIRPSTRHALWGLVGLDALTGVWMVAFGSWFDRTSELTALATLGGHHDLVLWVAACSFTVLLAAGAWTGGFVVANGVTRALLAVAAGASAVAAAGLLSLLAIVVGAVGVFAVLGRAFVR